MRFSQSTVAAAGMFTQHQPKFNEISGMFRCTGCSVALDTIEEITAHCNRKLVDQIGPLVVLEVGNRTLDLLLKQPLRNGETREERTAQIAMARAMVSGELLADLERAEGKRRGY